MTISRKLLLASAACVSVMDMGAAFAQTANQTANQAASKTAIRTSAAGSICMASAMRERAYDYHSRCGKIVPQFS